MTRNNFLPHAALALVLILVAAFAGQVRNWQRHSWVKKRVLTTVPLKAAAPRQAEQPRARQAEVFVRFRPGVSEEKIRSITEHLHDVIEDETEAVSGLSLIEDEDGKNAEAVIAEYSALPEVEYAEKVYTIQLEEARDSFAPVLPNDPKFSEQWALANDGQNGGTRGADISAVGAWATTTGNNKVVVAVLDSGVDYTHPDLVKNIWKRPENIKEYEDRNLGLVDDVHGYNALDNDADPMDQNGHGTHCAGIIGAEGGNNEGITGVNWTVQIMPLKFMDANGSGTTKDAIEAINYVIDRRKAGVNVRIISASWGSTQKSRALEDVIKKAYDEGILFVAASGNASVDNDKSPHYPSSYNVGNVISVAALDRNDQLTSFSNYGVKTVHIGAPGKDILSTWLDHEFRTASGTSMATPVVAGVAALVLANDPKLTVDELRRNLLGSVDKLPGLKTKVATGGRVNAAKAVGGQWKL
ncbi:MAG: Subtilisin-like serine protease [Acidobacteria bacterium]|nr:Subtilisin-like serine protease [Acidobacteriota bacterium]